VEPVIGREIANLSSQAGAMPNTVVGFIKQPSKGGALRIHEPSLIEVAPLRREIGSFSGGRTSRECRGYIGRQGDICVLVQ
jgi:hypothetical protein